MKKIENDNLNIIFEDDLETVANDMKNNYIKNLGKLLNLFELENYKKINVKLFNDLNEFREYVCKIRNISLDKLPKYCQSIFDNGEIVSYIDLKKLNENISTSYRINSLISHEVSHIIFKEKIIDKFNIKRPVWFDEGLAQNMSGEKNFYNEFENGFKDYYKIIKNQTKRFPKLENLKHGKDFVTNDYDGYKLSYLSVKYLIDNYGENYLKNILKDKKKMIILSENGSLVLNKAIKYYDEKFNLKNTNKEREIYE